VVGGRVAGVEPAAAADAARRDAAGRERERVQHAAVERALDGDRAVETCGADFVVMATHGRSGLGAFWADSVGHRPAEGVTVPLLIDATARR